MICPECKEIDRLVFPSSVGDMCLSCASEKGVTVPEIPRCDFCGSAEHITKIIEMVKETGELSERYVDTCLDCFFAGLGPEDKYPTSKEPTPL